jgi:hypothetical protein
MSKVFYNVFGDIFYKNEHNIETFSNCDKSDKSGNIKTVLPNLPKNNKQDLISINGNNVFNNVIGYDMNDSIKSEIVTTKK